MKLKRVADPMICPGSYEMDLYCDHYAGCYDEVHGYRPFPHQYHGETRGDVARQARRRGWVLHKDGTATCPKCSKRG